ncbi:alpha/beta hydrolase [soil metagenome]
MSESGSLVVRDQRVTTAAGSLQVRRWSSGSTPGDALPIVLLHESLGCITHWRQFPEQLARATGHAVVAYDRLGFGQSDAQGGRLERDFVTAEAQGGFAAVVDQLGIERFVPLGHSVGGGMALSIAAAAPTRCAGVVSMSAQTFVEDRTLAGIRAARTLFADPVQRERLARHHGGKVDWVLDAWIETWLQPAFAGWNLDDALPRIGCPVLAIHGEHDEYGSTRHPERIAAAAAGPVTMKLLPGCGHSPHREQPQHVFEAITAFMSTLAPAHRPTGAAGDR